MERERKLGLPVDNTSKRTRAKGQRILQPKPRQRLEEVRNKPSQHQMATETQAVNIKKENLLMEHQFLYLQTKVQRSLGNSETSLKEKPEREDMNAV